MEGAGRRDLAGSVDQRPLLIRDVVLVQVVELALLLVDSPEYEDAVSYPRGCMSVSSQRLATGVCVLEVPEVTHFCHSKLPKLN